MARLQSVGHSRQTKQSFRTRRMVKTQCRHTFRFLILAMKFDSTVQCLAVSSGSQSNGPVCPMIIRSPTQQRWTQCVSIVKLIRPLTSFESSVRAPQKTIYEVARPKLWPTNGLHMNCYENHHGTTGRGSTDKCVCKNVLRTCTCDPTTGEWRVASNNWTQCNIPWICPNNS